VDRGNQLEPPVALNSVWVAYPRRARKQRLRGTVSISFVVTKEGLPTDLHLIRAVARDLDESALRSVRRMRFKPAMLDNKPVPAHITIDVEFLLYF
jgi:TonB family protein